MFGALRSGQTVPPSASVPSARVPDLPSPNASAPSPTWRELFSTFAGIGLASFGGPTAQIAVMHRELVERRGWLSEPRFMHALNFCMLLPGPEAMQLVTYSGWLLRGVAGGLLAGVLFIAPGFVALLALSILYVTAGQTTAFQGLLFGLQAAVLALVVQAAMRIGRRMLRGWLPVLLASAAFASLLAAAPFPAVIAAAAGIGLLVGKLRPALLAGPHAADHNADLADPPPPPLLRTITTAAVWTTLWLGPLLALLLWLGPSNVFSAQAVFFSKTALVTFGGAYAVLAYVAQQAVEVYQWVTPEQMLAGMGMAETTPGPLIMVLQFVAFLGAAAQPGPLTPVTAGVLASVLATWVTFVPSFMFIFVAAPYVEALRRRPALTCMLTAITSAVVGVILSLAAWFAVHTLFAATTVLTLGPMRVHLPQWTSVNLPALLLALLAGLLLWRSRFHVLLIILIVVALGVFWRSLAP